MLLARYSCGNNPKPKVLFPDSTDLGCVERLARRLARRAAGRFWYVAAWRAWLVLEQGSWRVDETYHMARLVHAVSDEARVGTSIGNSRMLRAIELRAGGLLELPAAFAVELLPERTVFYCNERIRRTLPSELRPPRGFVDRNRWWNGHGR